MSATDDLAGVAGYIVDKISDEIGEDRLIPLDETGKYAYVDTEGCAVYLITIQRASLVPAVVEGRA